MNEFGTRAYSKIVRGLGKFLVILLFGAFFATSVFVMRRWNSLNIPLVYAYFFFFVLYVMIEQRAFRGPDEEAYNEYFWVRYVLTYTWWFLMMGALLEHSLVMRNLRGLSIVGIILSAAGICLGYWSTRTINAELGRRIETWEKLRIVEKGPYAIIRHPSYAANILLIIGMPLILNAFYCLVLSAIIIALFIQRLLWEERVLSERVPAYADYIQRTYRLIPGIW